MIFKIRYQRKADAADPHSEFGRVIYRECDSEPAWGKVVDSVRRDSEGDFAPESIKIEEIKVDPEKLERFRKDFKVYRL